MLLWFIFCLGDLGGAGPGQGDPSAHSGYNALFRDLDYAVGFLNEFQDRLFFGTDICSSNQEIKLPGFLINLKEEGRISEETFYKIAKKNSIKLLNLK